jgi:hypothetical protein
MWFRSALDSCNGLRSANPPCHKFVKSQFISQFLACFLTHAEHLHEPRRRFTLTPENIRLLNPNTRTCPVFRSQRDAEITKKIYCNVPVLIREIEGEKT